MKNLSRFLGRPLGIGGPGSAVDADIDRLDGVDLSNFTDRER